MPAYCQRNPPAGKGKVCLQCSPPLGDAFHGFQPKPPKRLQGSSWAGAAPSRPSTAARFAYFRSWHHQRLQKLVVSTISSRLAFQSSANEYGEECIDWQQLLTEFTQETLLLSQPFFFLTLSVWLLPSWLSLASNLPTTPVCKSTISSSTNTTKSLLLSVSNPLDNSAVHRLSRWRNLHWLVQRLSTGFFLCCSSGTKNRLRSLNLDKYRLTVQLILPPSRQNPKSVQPVATVDVHPTNITPCTA